MAYGIIRNNKYKYFDLNNLGRHIERKKANGNYMNPDIDKRKTYKNYSLKSCNIPYANCYKQIKEKYNLQGQIKKVSVIACEYVITASPDFFEEILIPLLLALIIPSGAMTLLKLVWKK